MARLESQLEGLASGQLPEEEPLDEATAELPLLVGAHGVMVPFRPDGRNPQTRIVWREIQVAVLARLGRRLTRQG